MLLIILLFISIAIDYISNINQYFKYQLLIT